jgi:chromatin remodeling complex protein RSC6
MLSYKKLHKLVYVKYNIRIRLRQADMYKREEDPFDKLMELSLYDSQNPIQDWMEHARSNEDLLLDEEDT